VEGVLREVANMADSEVQEIFHHIAMLPPISAAVLKSTTARLTDIFENSRDVSEEDRSTAPRKSSRLVKTPDAKGTRQSAWKKKKCVVDDSTDGGSCGESGSEYWTL
jgi:hypothetical protein